MAGKPRTADEWCKLLQAIEEAEKQEELQKELTGTQGVNINGTAATSGTNPSPVQFHVLSVVSGPRPCVDCGVSTGNFCDGFFDDCFAALRLPDETWGENQRTPLCTQCEQKLTRCKFCRMEPRSSKKH